jgi:hypothetical protein
MGWEGKHRSGERWNDMKATEWNGIVWNNAMYHVAIV